MSIAFDEHPITLLDKDRIINIRKKYGQELSALAFETLYIWKNFVGDILHLEDEMYTLNYTIKGENTWIFPCGDLKQCQRFIESHMGDENFSLCYLRQEDKENLEKWFPGIFEFMAAPDDSEYIINRQKHKELSGKDYSKLRRQINRAKTSYQMHVEILKGDNLSDANDIVRYWHRHTDGMSYLGMQGNEEDIYALKHYDELNMFGTVLYLDGQPYGVAAGYPLSSDTYDLFLAKVRELMPGLGYYLKYTWMQMLPENCLYVNLEDDLGIEGLKIMKTRLIPVKMNELWSAFVKKDLNRS